MHHSVEGHASETVPCTNYDLLIGCVTAPVSIDSQVY